MKPIPFDNPIYVTSPIIPDLESFKKSLEDVWNNAWFTNGGDKQNLLEQKLQELLKVEHLSLFCNGTIALNVACAALELKGEVITTPFTFPATPHAISWHGAKPVFCDIDPCTLTIDTDQIESLVTPSTTGIMGVHVYGIPCDVFGIEKIAKKNNLKVIYDGAHAFGTEIDGRGIGTFGDITMYSFHATKLFHTAEGGALSFSNPALKNQVHLLRNFGIQSEDQVLMPGTNGKMNEIQAALGLEVLKYLDDEWEKRAQLFQTYKNHLSDLEGIALISLPKNVRHGYQYCVVRIDEGAAKKSRDYFHQKLKEYNIITRKYFYPLCSDYPHYRSSRHFPVAEKAANEVLCLPIYGKLAISDIEKICQIIKMIHQRY